MEKLPLALEQNAGAPEVGGKAGSPGVLPCTSESLQGRGSNYKKGERCGGGEGWEQGLSPQ